MVILDKKTGTAEAAHSGAPCALHEPGKVVCVDQRAGLSIRVVKLDGFII